MCLNSKQLIHAYGPEKKVIIMPIIETINRIQRTAKLKVKKNIKNKILISSKIRLINILFQFNDF